jgi:phosphatidylglycerol:prolipoprotein diacylglycerol transferase
MHPILGRYGPFLLHSFTVVMGLGLLSGISLMAWQTKRTPLSDWFDGTIVSLSAGVLGGRAGFVAAQWSYFQERPAEIWQLWQGGLSYHGALLAGLLGLWGWCIWTRRSFGQYAGLLAPAFALLSAFGWMACWLEGCAYGQEATLGLLTADLPDEFGVYAVRYQTQLIATGLSLLLFVVVLRLRQEWRSVSLFWFTLAGLSAARVAVGLLRGDTVPHFEQIRLDVVGDGALALASLILLQYRSNKRSGNPAHSERAVSHKGDHET